MGRKRMENYRNRNYARPRTFTAANVRTETVKKYIEDQKHHDNA
jgi:hypothetical protein